MAIWWWIRPSRGCCCDRQSSIKMLAQDISSDSINFNSGHVLCTSSSPILNRIRLKSATSPLTYRARDLESRYDFSCWQCRLSLCRIETIFVVTLFNFWRIWDDQDTWRASRIKAVSFKRIFTLSSTDGCSAEAYFQWPDHITRQYLVSIYFHTSVYYTWDFALCGQLWMQMFCNSFQFFLNLSFAIRTEIQSRDFQPRCSKLEKKLDSV